MTRPEVRAGPMPRSWSPAKVPAESFSFFSSFLSLASAALSALPFLSTFCVFAAWMGLPASRRDSRAIAAEIRFTGNPPIDSVGAEAQARQTSPAFGRPIVDGYAGGGGRLRRKLFEVAVHVQDEMQRRRRAEQDLDRSGAVGGQGDQAVVGPRLARREVDRAGAGDRPVAGKDGQVSRSHRVGHRQIDRQGL